MARGAMNLLDLSTGQPIPLRAGPSGTLRLLCRTAQAPAAGAAVPADPPPLPPPPPLPATGVRALLVGDLVHRVVELHDVDVDLGWEVRGAAADGAVADALYLHRPARLGGGGGEAPDVLVEPGGDPAEDPRFETGDAALVRLGTGAVALDDAMGAGGVLAAVKAVGVDPLALRLLLLQEHYRTSVDVTRSALEEAAETLAAWRRLIAASAEQPSRPMPVDVIEAVRARWDDDLDLPGAIDILQETADDATIPPGALFELFAYVDRVLALDLVRDVGRT